jgi:hypothetical protein
MTPVALAAGKKTAVKVKERYGCTFFNLGARPYTWYGRMGTRTGLQGY